MLATLPVESGSKLRAHCSPHSERGRVRIQFAFIGKFSGKTATSSAQYKDKQMQKQKQTKAKRAPRRAPFVLEQELGTCRIRGKLNRSD
jgi:hypothetical protein